MAKDPAFLFYPGDWLGGTMTFTRAQKGAYMDLLMAQFNQEKLSIDDIKHVLGTDFWMWDAKLKSKFEHKDGLYSNPRLKKEVVRRRGFTDSRKDNLSKKPHMDAHMENEDRNEIENEHLKNEKFKIVFDDYLEMRSKIRKPATESAKILVLKTLGSHPLDIAIKMLEQSIMNSWQGIFPLKTDKQEFKSDKRPAEARQIIQGADETDKYLKSLRS